MVERKARNRKGTAASVGVIMTGAAFIGGCSGEKPSPPSEPTKIIVAQQNTAENQATALLTYVQTLKMKRNPDVNYQQEPITNNSGARIGTLRRAQEIDPGGNTLTETRLTVAASTGGTVFSTEGGIRVVDNQMNEIKKEECSMRRTGGFGLGEWLYQVNTDGRIETATIGKSNPIKTQEVIGQTSQCFANVLGELNN